MTKQDAIRLLRYERLGDSEAMELAKQMGAAALECVETHFIAPVCGKCGRAIMGVEIVSIPGYRYGNILMTSRFDPANCPTCRTPFVEAVINYEEKTCILKGEKEAPPE